MLLLRVPIPFRKRLHGSAHKAEGHGNFRNEDVSLDEIVQSFVDTHLHSPRHVRSMLRLRISPSPVQANKLQFSPVKRPDSSHESGEFLGRKECQPDSVLLLFSMLSPSPGASSPTLFVGLLAPHHWLSNIRYSCTVTQGHPWLSQDTPDVLVILFGISVPWMFL